MTTRLEVLTARRVALQVDCAQQRDDMQLLYGGIEDRVARVDRAIETVRSLAPAIVAAGVAVLFVLGPGRALRLLRHGLEVALYANQALRFLR
jgi:hypothetical protein